MTNTQITLIQIDNYGPWTVTPSPRREADLQTLQSRLYADLSQLIGNRGGYIFFTRFDNMIAVTNGLDDQAHSLIQTSIKNRYPVTISMSTATDEVPMQALGTASAQLQETGSAQDQNRREILRCQTLDKEEMTQYDVQIAHFDVDDATEKYTDQLNEFETFIQIEQGYAQLMRYICRNHASLSFFVGGDNVISVCPSLHGTDYRDVVDHVQDTVDVELKVGIGCGSTAQDAGMAAKHALEDCRNHETSIEQKGLEK